MSLHNLLHLVPVDDGLQTLECPAPHHVPGDKAGRGVTGLVRGTGVFAPQMSGTEWAGSE